MIKREGIKPAKPVPLEEARAKIQNYCAYQERSHHEVKDKLYSYGLYSGQVDELLSELITQGFLNEERFARAYAGGKFRMKKWGRLKIINEMERLGLTKKCINIGLSEIDGDDYYRTLIDLLNKKASLVEDQNIFIRKSKIAKYAIGKGFEPDLVWKYLKEFTPDGGSNS